jgi:YegS/Rv2252/BmrU family lipid kinase
MKIIVIFNPWANRGGAQKHRSTVEALCRLHQIALTYTQGAGDAQKMAYEAAVSGYDVVVAAGGDGTVHEVVNGLYQAQTKCRLGILPVGSGNDLAFGLGVPKKLDAAIDRILHGKPTAIDLARVEDENGRFLIADNNIGVGFDAQVVIETESIKRIGGFLLYLIATFRTLIYNFVPYPLTARFDGESVEQNALFVAFGVGRRGGGGFLLTPNASHHDNKVDSCFVRPVSRLQALLIMPSTLNGRHVNQSYITMRQSETITIHSDKPMPIHVDGEVFAYPSDQIHSIMIHSLPNAVHVML